MENEEDKIRGIIKDSETYAEGSGLSLSNDPRIVEAIAKGLATNEEKHGPSKRYCPCRPVTGNEEQDKKIICPCAYHKDEIKKDGKCHCGLFVRA